MLRILVCSLLFLCACSGAQETPVAPSPEPPPAASSTNRIDVVRPNAPELAAYGGFEIGVRTLELVHEDQLDLINATDRRIHPQL